MHQSRESISELLPTYWIKEARVEDVLADVRLKGNQQGTVGEA
jgi:hypothetical protein